VATNYQYDLDGRMTRSYVNAMFPTSYTYGALGLLRQVNTPLIAIPIKSWKYDCYVACPSAPIPSSSCRFRGTDHLSRPSLRSV